MLCSQTKTKNSRIKKAVLLWSDNCIAEILWCLKKKKEPNKRSHRHLRHPLHIKHCRTKGCGCPGCLFAQRRSGMIPTNRLWQQRTQLLRFELFRLHAALPWKHLGYAESRGFTSAVVKQPMTSHYFGHKGGNTGRNNFPAGLPTRCDWETKNVQTQPPCKPRLSACSSLHSILQCFLTRCFFCFIHLRCDMIEPVCQDSPNP